MARVNYESTDIRPCLECTCMRVCFSKAPFSDLDDFMHDIIGVCSLLLWFSEGFGVITQCSLPENLQCVKNDSHRAAD